MAFLNIEQAAQQFGTSVHTLRAVAKSGKLPGAKKIGGRWFVHCATLERYFESPALVAEARPAA
ncbi:MAG: helix-turn-helix domain-containing protein [Acidobacteriia bacterium]|nr:helix-turn-helix domain-containing protein [Terriglobia bacterium]